MRVTNDKISFDASDFDGLSDFALKALLVYVGERTGFATVFSDSLNAQIESAKKVLVESTQSSDEVSGVLRKLAAADSDTKNRALAAIQIVLDPVVAASPGSFLPNHLTPRVR